MRAIALGLAALFASSPAFAEMPERALIGDLLGNSSELLIRRGRQREPIQVGSMIRKFDDSLLTVAPNNARAILRFQSLEGRDLNFYIQTNSHPEATIYYFPCELQGGTPYIGWGLARNEARGCEEGVNVNYGRSPSAQAALTMMASAEKQISILRQITYCSASGDGGAIGFATATTGDPCIEALQQCQAAGGNCDVTATGRWWSSEEEMEAWLTCDANVSAVATGTGETIDDEVTALITQTQGTGCGVRVARPNDMVIIPAPDDVVIAQGDDGILVQTRDTADGVQVDVLKGAINVETSTTRAAPQLVTQGQRYTHEKDSGEVSTFDRKAALTSVDMEVLCAFASNSPDRLSVSACQEELDIDTTSGQTIAFCNREQDSGGSEITSRIVQMSASRGEITLEYEMFTVPDRIQIFQDDQQIFDTGFVSGNATWTIPLSGQSGRLGVLVTGNAIETTKWNYLLTCP